MYLNAAGFSVLLLVMVLIYLGLLHRVLDRMKLTKIEALIILVVMAAANFLPAIKLGYGLSIDIGGGLVPFGIALYLLLTADEAWEKGRAVITIFLTTVIVFISDRLLYREPGIRYFDIDPIFFPGLAAGITAYLFGRSRRGAFIGGTMAVLLLDLTAWLENFYRGMQNVPIVFGGGGVFGAAVIAGMLAVFLAEIIGEIRERLQGGPLNED